MLIYITSLIKQNKDMMIEDIAPNLARKSVQYPYLQIKSATTCNPISLQLNNLLSPKFHFFSDDKYI